MHKYEIIPHTADLRFLIQGDSLEELFRAGLESMVEYIAPGFCQRESHTAIEKQIKIYSADSTELLIDFLSEVLTLMHTQRAVLCRVDFLKLEASHLEAKLKGFSNGQFEKDIKAVTYHEAEIKKNESGQFQTNLVFDI